MIALRYNGGMDELTLAYLAGCMDSDGYFTIRRDDYPVRAGKQLTPTYQEQVGLRQVTPFVPTLLHSLFGGSLYVTKPSTPNGRPLVSWHANSIKASTAVRALLPFLHVKTEQANTLLLLRDDKDQRKHSRGVNGAFLPKPADAVGETLRLRVKELNRVGV